MLYKIFRQTKFGPDRPHREYYGESKKRWKFYGIFESYCRVRMNYEDPGFCWAYLSYAHLEDVGLIAENEMIRLMKSMVDKIHTEIGDKFINFKKLNYS